MCGKIGNINGVSILRIEMNRNSERISLGFCRSAVLRMPEGQRANLI
jgi:hypothetical protein